MRDGWIKMRLGDVTKQYVEPVLLDRHTEYESLGVKLYGQGTFRRPPKLGEQIKAARLFRIKPRQFVYNRLFAAVGSFALTQPEDAMAVASNEFPVFDIDSTALLPEFLNFYFQRPVVWEMVAQQCTGTTRSRLRWKEARFAAYTIDLPPLAEQQRIVDLFTSLDKTVESARKAAAHLLQASDVLRAALPNAEYVPLGTILTAIESGTSTKPIEGEGPRRRMLTLAAIRPARFDPRQTKDVGIAPLPDRARLRDGDLLITRSNTPDRVGHVAIARDVQACTYLPDLVWRLVPNPDLVSADYLAQVLSSPPLRAEITASASGTSQSMRKINKTNFKKIRVPLPALQRQADYVAPLAQAGDAYAAAVRHLDQLCDLRSRLLNAVLAGDHEIPESYDKLLAS